MNLRLVDDDNDFYEEVKSILIVDDNSFNLAVAESFVKELGYQTNSAYNGEEAINMVIEYARKGKHYSMIFMDI